MRTLLIGAGTGIRRRAERFIHVSTAGFALTAWAIFAAFVVEARDDVLHDARVEVVDSQHILGSHIDTAYESAETLLKVADSWLEEASLRPIRPPLSALASHMAALTESDERAIVIVTAEEDGTELPFSKVAIQQPVSTASPRDLTRDPADHDHTITVDAQRLDRFTRNQALPLTMRAGANAYGIKYLRALLPIRVGEGPFGLLMPGLPARIGVARPSGEIVSSWPIEGGPIGQSVAALSHGIAAKPDSAVFATVEDFPGLGRAYVSYAKVDFRAARRLRRPVLGFRGDGGLAADRDSRTDHPVRQQPDRPRRDPDRARDAAQPDRGGEHQAGAERRRGRQ